MADLSGFVATLPAQQAFNMPKSCCRCGADAQHSLASSVQVTGLGRKTRSVTFPYCTTCFDRAKRTNRARLMLSLSTMGIALVLSALTLLVPGLPIAVLVVVPFVLSIYAALALRGRAGESIDAPYGAWLKTASSKNTVFFMTRPEWAAQFGEANQVPAVPTRVGGAFHGWIMAGIVSAIGLGVLVTISHPSVYVDNEGPAPLQIWIDGKKSIVAPPQTDALEARQSITVPYGMHRFGWSAVDATAPTAQTEPTKIELAGDHLYNPGRTACYFLDLSLYGSGASASGIESGPVSKTELYTFKSINNWFSENPKSVSTKASHETRVSLQPMKGCYTLTKENCAPSVSETMVECQKAAYAKDDKDGYTACWQDAVTTCNKQRAK